MPRSTAPRPDWGSGKEFVRIEVKGSLLAESLGDEELEALAVESENALAEFVQPSGANCHAYGRAHRDSRKGVDALAQ